MVSIALLVGPSAALSLAQSACGGSTISYGGAIAGQINTAGATCSYKFSGASGETVALRMARRGSTSLDPSLAVTAPNRTRKTDNDSGGKPNSAIAGYTLPARGSYIIEASGSNRTTGSFVVALAICTALPSSGRSASASLASGQIACYQFTGRQGQAVDLRMEEGKSDSTFDPALDLYTPDGKLRKTAIARGSAAAQLTDTLPTSGTYTVIARSSDDKGAGSYTVKRYK